MDRSDSCCEVSALLHVYQIELQIDMRGGSESENASLRRFHAGIISSTLGTHEVAENASRRPQESGWEYVVAAL